MSKPNIDLNNQSTSETTNNVNDQPHGLVEKRNKQGKIYFRGNYVNGVEDGLHQHWDEDGKLAKSTNYKDGKDISHTKLKVVGYGGRGPRGHHNRFHHYQEHYIGDELMVTFDEDGNTKLTQYGLQSLEHLVENKLVSLNITDRSDVSFKNKVGNFFSNVTDIEYAKQVYANTMGEYPSKYRFSPAITKYKDGKENTTNKTDDENWHAVWSPHTEWNEDGSIKSETNYKAKDPAHNFKPSSDSTLNMNQLKDLISASISSGSLDLQHTNQLASILNRHIADLSTPESYVEPTDLFQGP
jgi:antitoxin component YwqK of YwqJK toxin-antitoxin module